MVLPGRYATGTPGWYDDYRIPNPEDYPGNEAGYQQAIADFVASQNGAPAGVAPTIDPVTGWRTAGSQRMADMTQGEYDANYLNSRMNSAAVQVANGNPDHPNAGPMFQLAMLSRMQNRPEQFQSAYNAAQAGTAGPTPILNDVWLNFLEANGYGPQLAPTGPNGGPDNLGPRPGPGVFDPSKLPVTPVRGAEQGDPQWHPGRDRGGDRPPTDTSTLPGRGVPVDSASPWSATHSQPGGRSPAFTFVPETNRDLLLGGGFDPASAMAGYAGGNPNTLARFEEFKRRNQMQPPIMPAALSMNGY